MTSNLSETEINPDISHTQLSSVIFISILIAVGVSGNAIVLFIFTKFYVLSTYRVFVRTLSIVDLVICMTYMPLDIVFQINIPFTRSEVFCKVFRFVVYGSYYLSFFLLILIAAERYRQICSPLKRQMSATTARVCALVAVCVSAVFAVPGFYLNGNHKIRFKGNISTIVCSTDDDYRTSKLYVVYFGLICSVYILATLYLVFVYISIIYTLKQRSRFRAQTSTRSNEFSSRASMQNTSSATDKERFVHSVRSTWSIIFITVIFIIVYAPYVIVSLIVGFDTSFADTLTGIKMSIFQLGIRLHMISNVANPFVYSFTDVQFRKACKTTYRKIMCFIKIQNSS